MAIITKRNIVIVGGGAFVAGDGLAMLANAARAAGLPVIEGPLREVNEWTRHNKAAALFSGLGLAYLAYPKISKAMR